MTPLAAPVAAATDLPLVSVLMVQVIGFSTMLLPYQSAPLMVMLQVAQVSLGAGARLTFALGLATLALLVPLDCLWWLVLGYLS